MSDIALSIRGLTKEYQILHNTEKHDRVTDAVASSVKGIFRKKEVETFRALDDVSFDVKKGEVLGVIGRNGAGKSTLLKVLSRITEPTFGEVHLFGRVGSLLEVGTGFHPELTGRENIFLNGAILGMRRREIERQFDEIVDFAEVEKFLDTPVKRYSSGMYVRLAFAVAAHLNPEILIVDEVLAVGDAQFQKKCLGKMQDVSKQDGRTVLFVSHNMGAITSLCNSAVLMSKGRSDCYGNTDSVIEAYLADHHVQQSLAQSLDGVSIPSVELVEEGSHKKNSISQGARGTIKVRISTETKTPPLAMAMYIRNSVGSKVSTICTPEEGIPWTQIDGEVQLTCFIENMSLMPDKYFVQIDVYGLSQILRLENILAFDVLPNLLDGATKAYETSHGIVRFIGGMELVDIQAGADISFERLAL